MKNMVEETINRLLRELSNNLIKLTNKGKHMIVKVNGFTYDTDEVTIIFQNGSHVSICEDYIIATKSDAEPETLHTMTAFFDPDRREDD